MNSTDDVTIPAELYMALATRRPELIKLIKPDEVVNDVPQLLKVIHFLAERNVELEDERKAISKRMEDMLGQLVGMSRYAKEIARLANDTNDFED